MTALKLIHSEKSMEAYRLAEMEAITQRMARRELKLKHLRERLSETKREFNDEDWRQREDQNRLTQLMNKRATTEIPPLEDAIRE